ncbi:outer membrane beta-barrel protein [Salmonella enterica subsp. enterica serovar Berkeley]|nr:outer membrane beta-barrel protein [Salmonella enterica subsp. enterica serovar Berkeley]
MKTVIAIAISSALMSASAYAHKEGDTIIKGGWASFKSEMDFQYEFQDQKEDKKNNSNGFALSLTHMASDKIGIELGYASGMTASYRGTSNYGMGRSQTNRYSIKGAPITLTANYYFGDANSKFRPYIGAGIAYVNFSSPKLTQTHYQEEIAPASTRALSCSPFGGCVEVPDAPTNNGNGGISSEMWPDWDMDHAMGVYPEPENVGTPDDGTGTPDNDFWGDNNGVTGTPNETPDMGTPDWNGGASDNFIPEPEYNEPVTSTMTSTIEDVQVDPGFGLAAKIGADYYVTDNFMITASVTYMDVKSKLSWTEKLTTNHSDGRKDEYTYKYSADMKVDPVYAMVGIGYRF